MSAEPMVDCEVVLKGGVMSGLVYARAFRRLSARYRFRAVAGSSAGAIAAAFVGAAEYARQGGDLHAFDRLDARCEALPEALHAFFRPKPEFAALMAALVHLRPGTGRARFMAAALCFWRPLSLGAAIGGLGMLGFYTLMRVSAPAAAPGFFLAAFTGGIVCLATYLVRLLWVSLPRANFGLCTGMAVAGEQADITDWLYSTLQDLAFGQGGRTEPLTFGDLAGRGVDLRIVATNLNSARLEVLPIFDSDVGFDPASWSRLFPRVVVEALAAPGETRVTKLGTPDHLPVAAAVRMSIACPGLLEAVPLRSAPGQPFLMVDGGVGQTFPLDVLGDLGKGRERIAIDLATLHGEQQDRVTTVGEGLVGHDRPRAIHDLPSYLWALLVAIREAATRTTLLEPPYRDQTLQVWLTSDEGGMSLDMTPSEAERLMGYGEALASYVLRRQDRVLAAQ